MTIYKITDMENLNTYIRKSHMKMVRKFNDELEAFRKETEEDVATLYEDAFTSFTLSTLRIDNGCLLYDYDGQEERDEIVLYDETSNDFFERDMDGIADIVGFFRKCLRRARKYWNMGGDRLDAIQDGMVNDIDLED